MSGLPWVAAGVEVDTSLPADRLTDPELGELRQLLAAHEAARQQLAALEHRLSLFVVTARDRRGLAGRVHVNPDDGTLQTGVRDGRD